MRSDWDDAPDYLRERNRRSGVGRLFIAAVLGGCITGIALYVMSISFTGWERTENVPAVTEAPQSSDENLRAMMDEPIKPIDTSAEAQFWRDVDARKAQPKQTDFNDSNYVPRQPQNIVSTEALRNSQAYKRQSSEPATKSVQVEHDAKWIEKWSGGGSYLAEWTSINNRIDSTTVCSNHKRGSIDYRECRKGAKQFFKEQCRAWDDKYDESSSDWSYRMRERYCSAAGSFSPMG